MLFAIASALASNDSRVVGAALVRLQYGSVRTEAGHYTSVSQTADWGQSQIEGTTDERLQRELLKKVIQAMHMNGSNTYMTVYTIDERFHEIMTDMIYYYYNHGWKNPQGDEVPNDDLMHTFIYMVNYENYLVEFKIVKQCEEVYPWIGYAQRMAADAYYGSLPPIIDETDLSLVID